MEADEIPLCLRQSALVAPIQHRHAAPAECGATSTGAGLRNEEDGRAGAVVAA